MWEIPKCNTTLEDAEIFEQPIWNGYTIHQIGLVISAIFGLIAIIVSFYLILMHGIHYSRPAEQRHIIRILFMVPIYAAVSFLSLLYYQHSVYFEVLRDCYEAFAIASFFSLMCAYIAEDLHRQKEYFRTIQPKNWVWPMGWFQKCCGGKHGLLRTPRSGLTWFNIIWVAVFQYCFIRVAMTVVAVVTQVFDRYCLESLHPAFAHVWVMVIEATAVTIAMYCLIQFYVQIKQDIARHKPLLKVFAIKLVIFLSFWQTFLISFLTGSGALKSSDTVAVQDLKIGIPAMLLCIEMSLFAVFHIWAFSYRPYSITSKEYQLETVVGEEVSRSVYKGGFMGWRAFVDAFNPWDLVKAVGRSGKWLFRDRRTRLNDISYAAHLRGGEAGSHGHAEQVVGGAGGAGQDINNTQSTTSTAYVGAGPRFAGVEANEGDNLLQNPQAMPMSRPVTSRYNTARSGISDDYEMPDSDIGVARSRYDDDVPTAGYSDNEWEHTPNTTVLGGQETGVIGGDGIQHNTSRTEYNQRQESRR